MKRAFSLILAMSLVFAAGCSAKMEEPAEQPTVPEITEIPETTVPETVPPETAPRLPKLVAGTIQGNNIPGILCLVKKGDYVEVTGYPDQPHATVKTENGIGTVDRELLRFVGDEAYESWTAYARYNTALFRDYRLVGEPSETLKTNTELTVLDELESCYVVQAGNNTGCVAKSQVNKWRITSKPKTDDGGGSSSGGSPGRQDGDNISLTSAEEAMGQIVLLSNVTKTGSAEIRADGGAVVLKHFNRGDTVQIVAEEGFAPELPGYTTILEDDIYAYIPTAWISREGEEEFSSWDGFAGYNCYLYDNYELCGKPVRQVYANKNITVLWNAGEVLLIRVGEELGYIHTNTARTTRIPKNNSGDGSGGGSFGGGSSSGGGGAQWTPPAM